MSTSDNSALVPEAKAPAVKRQTSTIQNDPDRFKFGVLIRGKFIGVEDVKEESGDEVCQLSMVKLKAVVLAKKEHKLPICIKINLEGIEILDAKTNQSLYKHSVNRISYIARDVNDPRAIGYIYKNTNGTYQYFAIKTEKQAQELFNTLKDLFEVVMEIRKTKDKTNSTSSASSDNSTKPVLSTQEPTGESAKVPAPDNNQLLTIDNQQVAAENKPAESNQSESKPAEKASDLLDSLDGILNDAPNQDASLIKAPVEKPKVTTNNELLALFDTPSSNTNQPPAIQNLSLYNTNMNSLYSNPQQQQQQQLQQLQQQQQRLSPLPLNPNQQAPNMSQFGQMSSPGINQYNPLLAQQNQFTNQAPSAYSNPFQQNVSSAQPPNSLYNPNLSPFASIPPPVPPMPSPASPQANSFKNLQPNQPSGQPNPNTNANLNSLQLPW